MWLERLGLWAGTRRYWGSKVEGSGLKIGRLWTGKFIPRIRNGKVMGWILWGHWLEM